MSFFQVKIKHIRLMDDGSERYVTEPYLVNADSVLTAEAALAEHLNGFLSEYSVEEITKPRISEVFEGGSDVFYRCKVAMFTIDERTAKEKRSACYIYVNADNFDNAVKRLKAEMGAVTDYEIELVQRSPIVDYIVDGIAKREEE